MHRIGQKLTTEDNDNRETVCADDQDFRQESEECLKTAEKDYRGHKMTKKGSLGTTSCQTGFTVSTNLIF